MNGHAQLPDVHFRDFCKLHQRHDTSMNVVELDACLGGTGSFLEALQVGTSVEWDHRMRAWIDCTKGAWGGYQLIALA